VCDPDTGACTGAGGGLTGAGSSSEAAAGAVPLAARSGWTSTQTLMLLAGLLTVGLVLAPGVAVCVLSKQSST